ncbi:MAG TPA: complex I subunit 5 family protein [Gaiellaceae bacterium]
MVPLLAAALITAIGHFTPRVVHNAVAVAGTLASFVFSLILLVQSMPNETLHWFGGWTPRSGVAIGIAFTGDPFGAGMSALASGLTLAALLYSLAFLEEASHQYHVLMAAFGGAMCGFALTGDLFNMFVWFELMGVAAYALAGFKIGELGTLQGAINFAVTNTVGAYLILVGIALLYARTGALNFAQIGRTLAGRHAGGLEIMALTLVLVGFLVKAAIVPFHFWLADAHAVAPAPVCVLFSGAMVELGLFGVARCYWTIFDAPFGAHQIAIRNVLIVAGLLTAFVGALMAYFQAHLKRLLAYSTISHAGVMLIGVGLLDSRSLGGVATLVLSHGLLKAGLFLAAGVLFVQLEGIDELRLRGRGRPYRALAVLFFLGAIGLIGVPYVGSYVSHAEIDEGATLHHLTWIGPLLMIVSALSSAAILRAGARVFLGWGPKRDWLLTQQEPEKPADETGNVSAMVAITGVLIVLGLLVSVVPGLQQRAEYGAERMRDRAAYAERVLHDAPTKQTPARLPFVVQPTGSASVLYGIGAGVLAFFFVAFGLWRERLPGGWRAAGGRVAGPPIRALKLVHSGVIGDYVMWLTLGTALLAGVWAITLR